MEKKERMFKDIREFLNNMATLDEEVREAELKKFSAIDRANILATEYIAADIYPVKHVNRNIIKLSLTFKGKVFYPIVGWNPDAASPLGKSLTPPVRRWLSGKQQYHLHNTKENRTYILYA